MLTYVSHVLTYMSHLLRYLCCTTLHLSWQAHLSFQAHACTVRTCTRHTHVQSYTYANASCICMGWLRLVGSLKLQVSFAKEPYKRDDILQKRPIILRNTLQHCKTLQHTAIHADGIHMCSRTYTCAYRTCRMRNAIIRT